MTLLRNCASSSSLDRNAGQHITPNLQHQLSLGESLCRTGDSTKRSCSEEPLSPLVTHRLIMDSGSGQPCQLRMQPQPTCPATDTEPPCALHCSTNGSNHGSMKRNHTSSPQPKRRIKRKKPPLYLKATVANFSTFCQQTSLHGWQYIAQKNTSSAKHVFWAIVVSMSMAAAATFLYNNTMDYFNATVVTTVDTMTVPLTEVFFPSVVVCNINQVRKSFFEELGIYDNETFIRQIYFDYIEGKSSNNLHQPSTTTSSPLDPLHTMHTNYYDGKPEEQIALHKKILEEYLAKMNGTAEEQTSINWVTHQKCKDMFILSKWNGTTTYDFEIERDFGTDYGICCWYTPQLNFTEIINHMEKENLKEPAWGQFFTNITKGAKTGKDNGYTMLFDIESFDYSYYDEGSEGLKVALVHHLDMPIMRQTGFHIAPGTENQIAVTPTLIVTSDSAMKRFTPAERDCYSEDEISLKYLPRDHGYRYEMSNCLFESAFENILKVCKCFPGFHTMGGEHAKEKYDVCIGPNLTCMNDLMNRMGQFDHVDYKGVQVKCRSNCEDQINSLFVTTSSYPNRKTLIYREEFCIVARSLIDKCNGPKKKPLEREYPNLCTLLEPIKKLKPSQFCKNNAWDIPRNHVPNCTSKGCPVEDAILEYAKENLVMFNIFIKDPYAKRFQKDEKITKTSYIANSGGLLGLCMGFSFISGAEILFHCFFGIFSAIFPSEKRKLRVKTASRSNHNQDHHHNRNCAMYYTTSVTKTKSDLNEDVEEYEVEEEVVQADGVCFRCHHSAAQTQLCQAGSSVPPPSYDQHCCPHDKTSYHVVHLQDGTVHSEVFPPPNDRSASSRPAHKNAMCQTVLNGNPACIVSGGGGSSNVSSSANNRVFVGPERII